MLKIILIGIPVIIVVLLIIVAVQPAEFRITRTATISAPAAVVFAQVNDLHKWEAWSPWEKVDPALKRTFEGPSSGTGAIYKWVGNNKVGEGSMTITASRPSEMVRFKLEFLRPFKATNTAEFTFQSEGDHTTVTWTMDGKKVFLTKAIGLFMNMDKMIGGQFEKGLADMKSLAEGAVRK